MSGDSTPTDIREWMRDVVRRIEMLERRRTVTNPASRDMKGMLRTAAFTNGVAHLALPGGVGDDWIAVGSFSYGSGIETGIAVSVYAGQAHLRAAVTDGSYPVHVIMTPPS